jgi:hypothetical protein
MALSELLFYYYEYLRQGTQIYGQPKEPLEKTKTNDDKFQFFVISLRSPGGKCHGKVEPTIFREEK